MGNQKSKAQPALNVAYFCKQLDLLVKSGVNMQDAMAILHENAQDKTQKALYAQLTETVKQGMPLAAALTQTGQYPAYMTQMVQIGETSGKLDEVLEALYVYYERMERINRGIKNVVTYPVVMVCVMLAVIAVLLIKAVPIFAQVFQQIGAEIPSYLKAFATDNAATVFLIVIAVFAAAALAAYMFMKYTHAGQSLKIKLYENSLLTRNIAKRADTNKFAFAMALLLSAGINIDEAVAMVCDLTESEKMKGDINRVIRLMDEQVPFPAALTRAGLLSPEYGAMITVGQKAGKLDEMMNTVAARLAEEADEWLERLISGFEPTIVIVMSLTVGGLLLSIMMPLMKIMSAM